MSWVAASREVRSADIGVALADLMMLAGGYDAIWLLVCDPEDPSPEIAPYKRVQHVWTKYEELDVSPLLARESKLKGARIEKMEDIKGLEKATELPH